MTDKRSIKTNVMVDDGQVVVLGGLIEESIGEDIQKVPLLGDIPLLGNLFRSRSADVTRTNLMVFIHPVILRDSVVTSNYTNSKYNFIRSLQMNADEDGVNLMYNKKHPVLPTLEEFTAKPGEAAVPAAPAAEPAPEPEPQTNLFPDE